MAFTTGTATGHYDLLNKLRQFLVNQTNWVVLRWTDDAGATANGRGSLLNLRGPGAGVGRNVFLNISTVNNDTTPSNGWQISGAINYSGNVQWGNQPGESPQPYFNLWTGAINYWFYVNDRRIVVIAQISTTFVSMYGGFFLPWGTPAQYPTPLYVGGDWWAPCNWSLQNSGRRMCCDPGGDFASQKSAAWVKDPVGLWRPVCNQNYDNSSNDAGTNITSGAFAYLWPWTVGRDQYSNAIDTFYKWGSTNLGATSGGCLDSLVTTRQGERFIWPNQIVGSDITPFGTLDGIYATFGAGLSTTAPVTSGGKSFLAFQNIHRNSGNDFFLMEQA